MGNSGWRSAVSKAKARYARRMALGKHWKTRWEQEPEFMRANLDRLIAQNKRKAAKYSEKLDGLVRVLPATIKSWELRQTISAGIKHLGGQGDRKQVHRVVMALRRRKMLTYSESTLSWTVAISSQSHLSD